MATVVNGPGIPQLRRGSPVKLGAITASGQSIAFTSPSRPNEGTNGFDSIQITTDGNLVATVPILEGSLDGAATWFGIVAPTAGSSAPTIGVTTLTGDTAASTANDYIIPQGIQLRFGFNTYTSGSGNVWVYMA